jgi:hypothetical protein
MDEHSIGNKHMETINWMNITIEFFGNSAMSKIMGASTVNYNDDFSVLDVSN